MSSKWIVLSLGVFLTTSFLNLCVLAYHLANPPHPVNIKGMTAKAWTSDREFKKAVESIAESTAESTIAGMGYHDEDEVQELIKKCVVRTGGKISC
jgi:hypothetical protein